MLQYFKMAFFVVLFCHITPLTAYSKKQMEDLLNNIVHENVEIRIHSIDELAGRIEKEKIFDKRVVEILISLLGNKNENVFESAANALDKIKHPKIIPFFISELNRINIEAKTSTGFLSGKLSQLSGSESRNDLVYRVLIEMLGELKHPHAVPEIIKAFKHQSEMVRQSAVFIFTKMKDPRVVEPLIATLKDKDANVREYSVMALGYQADPQAITPLLETFSEGYQSASIYTRILKVFGNLKAREVLPVLTKELQNTELDADYRAEVANTLGYIEDLRAVDALIKVSKSKDEANTLRANAIHALGKIKAQKAMPYIISCLVDNAEDAFVRKYAAKSLGLIGDKKAVEPLLKIAKGNGEQNKNEIEKLGEDVLPQDAELLKSIRTWGNSDLKQNAIEALGNIGHKDAIPFLIEALADNDKMIRLVSAQALSKVSDIRAIDALIKALNDENENVRSYSVVALGNIKDRKVINHLVGALDDKSFLVRSEAFDALVKIKIPEDKMLFLKFMQDKSKSIEVRVVSTKMLKYYEGPDVINALINALNDEHFRIRQEAAKVLGHFKTVDVLSRLFTLLKNDEWWGVRESAAEALGEIGKVRAEDSLIEAMNYNNYQVRKAIIIALGKIKSRQAIPVLQAILENDWSPRIRKDAKEALNKINQG